MRWDSLKMDIGSGSSTPPPTLHPVTSCWSARIKISWGQGIAGDVQGRPRNNPWHAAAGRTSRNPKGPELANMVPNDAKLAINSVAKYDANLALSPRSRQAAIESSL
ncbi:hypothetical protein TNCV_4615961 [Trichonephila clavipes]|nr:hypothetical protein TNCV_4615961 [Trichonephila clavipes]